MMSKLRASAVIFAFVAFAANAAFADVEQDMQEMRSEIDQLQQRLESQQQQLDEAREADAVRSSGSRLSTYFDAVEFDVWAAVNYTFNTRGDGNDHIIDQNSNATFHNDSHAFQVDQLWFSMDKPVSEESRAGFHADIAFGETARNASQDFGGSDVVAVYSAYLSYLLPGGIGGGGIRVDAGELWTLLGAEVVPAHQNFNITRGIVWGLQPVNNTGAIISTDVGPVSFTVGLVNAPLSNTATDSDRNKTWTGQIAFELNDNYSVATSFVHGSAFKALDTSGPVPVNTDNEKRDVTIIDLVVLAQPIEELALTLNYDYRLDHPKGATDVDTHGIAVAGRYQVTDRVGAAGRFEVVLVDDGSSDTEEYSVTLTGDYEFNKNFSMRGEVRLDWGIEGAYARAGQAYDDDLSNHQTLLSAELIYRF